MKKKLIAAAVATVMVAQSTPSFADQPATWGLCRLLPQNWGSNWIPCYPDLRPGQSGGHSW